MLVAMPRPQFTLRALLVAMLIVAAFFGGVRYERERRRREDAAIAEQKAGMERMIIGVHPPLDPTP